VLIGILTVLLLILAAYPYSSANGQATLNPPTIDKFFDGITAPQVDIIHAGKRAVLSFTLNNPNGPGQDLTGVNFVDQLPPNVLFVTPIAPTQNTCGGTLTATNNGSTGFLSLTGAVIPGNGSCQIAFLVTSSVPGNYDNRTSAINAQNATSSQDIGEAILSVVAALQPPIINKTFTPSTVAPNATSTVTITIQNPNNGGSPFDDLVQVNMTDALPASLTIAGPISSTNCLPSSSVTLVGNTITVTDATIQSGQTCTISVQVQAPATSGVVTNSINPANVTFDGGTYTTPVSANLNVVVPLQVSKAFGGTFQAGQTTTLTFTITNPAGNPGPHTNIQLNDNLPAGLFIANSTVVTNPNGCLNASAVPGAGSVAISGGPLAVGAACTVQVNVTSPVSGNYTNTTQPITSVTGGQTVTGGTASASVTVNGPDMVPPSITKQFIGTQPINNGDHIQVQFTINNPNTIPINGVSFTDVLPTGGNGDMIVTNPNNLSFSGCGAGATITAVPASTSISLSGGTIAAGGQCVITLDVTGVNAGNYTNTTSPVNSINAGQGNTGSATLAVQGVGTGSALTIAKQFLTSPIAAGATSQLRISITNPDNFAQFGVTFTDNLPTLTVAPPQDGRLRVANPAGVTFTPAGCTGTITAAVDTQIVRLTNGFVPANTTCVLTVNVTSSTAGSYDNQTGPVTSTNVPGTNTSNTATLVVNGPSILPPNISKAFAQPAIAVNGTTTLTFTISNPNAAVPLTNVRFTDAFPTGILSSTTPNIGGTCTGTLTPAGNRRSVTGTIPTLAGGATCTFTVDVVGANPGSFTNQSGPIRSDNGGDNLTQPATAPIRVEGPPTVNKQFSPGTIQVGGTSTLTITITNPNANPDPLTNVSLSDILPNLGTNPTSLSQMLASNLQIVSGCGVGATFTSSTDANGVMTLNFTNGTILPNTNCVLQATVTAPAVGNYVNQTQPVTSGNGGTGGSSNQTTLRATGLSQNLQVSKAFNPTTLRINEISRMSITIRNPDNQQQTGVSFSDTLPSGLLFASGPGEPNQVGNCGGTVTVNTGTQTIALTNGVLAAAGSAGDTCTLSIDVTSPTPNANYSNTVSVTSLQVNTATTASASLTFIGPPSVTKNISPNPIAPGQNATMTLTIVNPNQLTALDSVTLTDLLPAGMSVVSLGTPTGCGANPTYNTTTVGNQTQINFSGGTVNAGVGVTCTLTATVTALPGNYTNTIRAGDVTTSNAGNNPPPDVSAQLTALGFSIGNRIWFDTNDDGQLNNGEVGVSDVLVRLYPANAAGTITGPAVATTTTDANGYYRFDGIPAGTYVVAVDQSNWQGSGPLIGYASSTNNIVQNGASTPDSFDNGRDNASPATSANGILSTAITVGLGQMPSGEDATAPAAGHTASYQNNGVTTDAGDTFNNLTADFGFYRLTLNGTVWNDSGAGANTNNGRIDAGEPGINGVVVQLLKGGVVVAQTTTTNGGQYRFDQQTDNAGNPTGNPLVVGSDYSLRIVSGQPALNNFVSSTDLASTFNPTNNGNGTPSDDNGRGNASANTVDTLTDLFTLNVFGKTNTAGSVLADAARAVTNQPTIDFGFHTLQSNTFSVGNRVWFDNGAGGGTANNGIQDGAEAGIDGVRVLLYQVDATNQPTTLISTTTTSGGGYYRFDSVPPGNYVAILDTVNSPVLNGLIVSNNTYTNFGTAGDRQNKGQQTPLPGGSVVPGGIISVPFTVSAGTLPTGEPDVDNSGTNPPAAHGPNGDASDVLTVDFGLYRPAASNFSIGNRVFLDNGVGGVLGSANNGIQDGSEPGIANVTVVLFAADNAGNPTGAPLQTVNTDSSGYYRFDNVPPGSYVVVVDQTASAALTGLNVSSVTSTDFSTAGDRANKGQPTPLPGGSVLPGGIRSGVIAIPPANPVTGEPDVSGVGFGAHGPNGDANDVLTADFGFFQNPATAYSIGNRVWLDNGTGGGTASNGIQDGPEPGLVGVPIRLYNANAAGTPTGSALQTTVTDANGYYRFDGVNPGNYVVVMDLPTLNSGPTKYQLTPVSFTDLNATGDQRNKGLQTPLDASTPLPGGIASPLITIPVGGNLPTGEPDVAGGQGAHGPGGDNRDNLTLDFGLVPIAANSFSIGNRVFLDNGAGGTPNNGIQEGTEPGIPNVTVVLFAADNAGNPTGAALQTVNTDGSGYYRFDNVAPGDYVVVVDQAASANLNGLTVSGVTSTDFTTAGDRANKGQQTPLPGGSVRPGGIRSGVITVPPAAPVTGEPDVTGAGFGAHGPNGDTNDVLTADFGFFLNPANALSIGNRVWLDNGLGGGTPNNGLQDGTEPGIPNVGVRLFFADAAGTPIGNGPVASTVTDANGYYRFDGLIPGTYVVVVDKAASPILSGFVPSAVTFDTTTNVDRQNKGRTAPLTQGTLLPGGIASGPIQLTNTPPTGEPDVAAGAGANGPNGDARDNLTIDFGFVNGPTTYSIGNRVWADNNDDGIQQSNEPPIGGVRMLLYRADSNGNPTTLVGSVVTDSQGFYRFDGLDAGNYIVIVDVANSPALAGSHVSDGPVANPQTNTTDALNNGIQTPLPGGSVVPGGIRSGLISLGARPSEPIGETVPTSYGPGSVFTLNNVPESSDDRGNLTIDFGFVFPNRRGGGGGSAAPVIEDPAISKSGDPALVGVGEIVTWTINVTNPNSVAITDVQVSDSVPGELEILSARVVGGQANVSGQAVYVSIPRLEAKQTVSIVIVTRVRQGVTSSSLDNIAELLGRYKGKRKATIRIITRLPSTGEHPDDWPTFDTRWLWVGAIMVVVLVALALRRRAV
jgi:uncharacterized repeat protein (TIGR01451 family)